MAEKNTLTKAADRYPKGDSRRALALIAAVDQLGEASLDELARLTGFKKPSVLTYIHQAGQQFDVTIVKQDARYSIASWGNLLKPRAVRKLIK